ALSALSLSHRSRTGVCVDWPKSGDPAARDRVDPPVVGEQLPRRVPSGIGIPSRADVVLPARAPARPPLVVPEVQVVVPVDPTHPKATTDSHSSPPFYLCSEVGFRSR